MNLQSQSNSIALDKPQFSRASQFIRLIAQSSAVMIFHSDMKVTALLNLSVTDIMMLNPSVDCGKVRIKSMIIM